MGIHKSSKTKNTSSSSGRKHKSLSTSKKPASTAQNTRSQHFPPPAPAPVVAEFKSMRGWEEWENQLIVALRVEGKNFMQISQRLPGRTEAACRIQHGNLKARSQNVNAQEKDALAFPAPKKQKKWEDWEDRIVVTQHNAGKEWEEISQMLHPRSANSVRFRWSVVLEHRPQNSVGPQTRPANARPLWKSWEEQLLKPLVESGKSWAEIATQLPNRSARSCYTHWYRDLLKNQGKSTKKAALPWEEWEERLLVSGYYAGLNWEEITEPITGRTSRGARNQWMEHFHSSDQDEPWTSAELALLAYLRREGSGWDEISQELPGHTSNACRTQWYKETEGIQGPSSHKGTNDTWSAEEVEVLVALYNTIGPRWQEICKHLPGRTECACKNWLNHRCTKEDGVGGPPSEFWKEFFMNEPGDIGSEPIEAASDTHTRDDFSTPRLTRSKQSSLDARKRKVINIPMV